EMEIMERLSQPEATFDSVTVNDLPLVVFIGTREKDSAAIEALCQRHMKDIIALAADTERRAISARMDNNGFRTDFGSPRDVYQKYVRESAKHARPDRPAFDSRILDHNCINALRQKCGFSLLKFSRDTMEGDMLYPRAPEYPDGATPPPQIYPSSPPSPGPAP
ncbi:MAG TPA: hypothetical protein VIG74_01080, partial [Alphaproteobacteria bacterium]